MKFGVFFKRILPFILTLTIGLVVASFFVSLTFPRPNFRLGSERRSHVHECKQLKQEVRELRRENRKLKRKLEKRSFNVSELDRLVPPVPPAPPRPMKEMKMTPMVSIQ